MAEIYTSGTSFSTPTVVRAWVEYPFRNNGDSTTKVYHHIMQVKATSYTTLSDDDVMTTAGQKPNRSPFADDSAAYYVGDYGKSHIGDGLVEFDRQFANIPQDRSEPNGFYSFEFPANTEGIFSEFPTLTESSSYNTSTLIVTINFTLSSTDATSINDGDSVVVYNAAKWDYTRPGVNSSTTSWRGIVSKSGTSYTITDPHFYTVSGVPTAFSTFVDNNTTNYDIRKYISPERSTTAQLNSPSVISYRYFKLDSLTGMPLQSQFKLSTSSNLATSTLGTTTEPLTRDNYIQAALDGEYAIGAEDESITRWKGNIYEFSQIKVLPR